LIRQLPRWKMRQQFSTRFLRRFIHTYITEGRVTRVPNFISPFNLGLV
jgi:hypothetical protein